MITDDELDAMRDTSQLALTDHGAITRDNPGAGTLNDFTGEWTPTSADDVYVGPMRVRPPTPAELERVFGDIQVTKQRYVATIPWDADPIRIDDRLTLDSSSDAMLVARPFRIITVSTGSFHIDRRLGLEVIE